MNLIAPRFSQKRTANILAGPTRDSGAGIDASPSIDAVDGIAPRTSNAGINPCFRPTGSNGQGTNGRDFNRGNCNGQASS